MLSVWLGDGRHNWKNADFDAQVKKAAAFAGDPAMRVKMFQDAEKILVSDVGGVFIYTERWPTCTSPYLKGNPSWSLTKTASLPALARLRQRERGDRLAVHLQGCREPQAAIEATCQPETPPEETRPPRCAGGLPAVS